MKNSPVMSVLRLVIILMILIAPFHVYATGDRVKEDQALSVARAQLTLFCRLDTKGFQSLSPYISHTQTHRDTVLYYVVSFHNRRGFVVVPGTTRANPWFAVSSKDVYDAGSIPPPMQHMLGVNERKVLRAIRAGERSADAASRKQAWQALEGLADSDAPVFNSPFDTIGPLVTTEWGQEGHYNQKCPYHGPACDNGHALAGCGPVAMAQLMRYHEYPYNYEWNNMPISLTEDNNDVANLIRDCGEAAASLYTCVGTATLPRNMEIAMKYTFKYYQSVRSDVQIAYNASNGIASELRNGFPVIMEGRDFWNPFSWHIFVIDGVKLINNYGWEKIFHINWGWEGAFSDMWFYIDDADPPGDPGPYDYDQSYVHKLYPAGEVTITSPEPGSAHPSMNPLTVEWTSTGHASTQDSAMIILSMPYDGYGKEIHYVNGCYTDTIFGVPNKSGANSYTLMLRSHPSDTIFEYIQVMTYGKYRYRSQMVPVRISQGERLHFITPNVSTVFQSNMHNLIQWEYNPNTNPTFLLRYLKKSGPGTATSGSIVASTQGGSFNWMVPPGVEGRYYLELRKTDLPLQYVFSDTFTISPPASIDISQPVPNAVYQPGNTMGVRWSSNYPGNVRIKLWRYDDWNLSDTTLITASTANDGIFDWSIPVSQQEGTLYALTVEGVGNPQVLDQVSYFTIKKLITVTKPVAGTEWEMNSEQMIEWQDNFPQAVDIKLYRGLVLNRTIALNTPSDGAFSWMLPTSLSAGINYRVGINKVGDETGVAYSDFFSVYSHRWVTLSAPDGWSEWMKGHTYFIKWNSNVAGPFTIKLIDILGTNRDTTTLTTNAPWSSSGYSWTVPSSLSLTHLYQVMVICNQYPTAFATSDPFRIILEPYVLVSYPRSTSHWPSASVQTITWNDNLPGAVEIVLYNAATGLMVNVITPETESDGFYSWNIPQTLAPGTQYYIIVRSKEYGSAIQDASDQFEITLGDFITVTAPAAGTNWLSGSTRTITWNDNVLGDVRIILRKPSIGIQDTLTHGTPSSGSFSWTIPVAQVPATNYNILIQSVANSSIEDISDPFQISSATGSFITVKSPTADSVWKKGTVHPITWDDNILYALKIELFRNNVFLQIISAFSMGNSLQWTVPTGLNSGGGYQVKVSYGTIADFSENFTVTDADFITYQVPGAFRMGETSTISWNDNIGGPVKIELLLADTLFRVLAASTESDGQFEWTPPTVLPAETWYKIRISAVDQPQLAGLSAPVAVYYPYFIRITSPEAGAVLLMDSSYAIQWDENFVNSESFRIDLFRNGDSVRVVNAYRLTGYYLWSLNVLFHDLPAGDNYTLRVKCNDKPEVFSFSDPFTIIHCDSLLFSTGSDTSLVTTGTVDLIPTDGYENYSWTPFQTFTRVNHIDGSDVFPGIYTVVCQAVHSGGCVRKDTLILTVQEPPCVVSAEFTAQQDPGAGGCYAVSFINTDSAGSGCLKTWDFGDVTTETTLATVVNHNFPGPGQFIVTCSAADTTLAACTVTFIDTVDLHAPPVMDFGYSFSVDTGLFVSSVSGPGQYRVRWNIDSIPADNVLNRPDYTSDSLLYVFPDNGSYRVEMVVFDSLNPGCSYSVEQIVVVSTLPPCHKTKGFFAVQPAYGYESGNRHAFLITGGYSDQLTCHTFSVDLGDGTTMTDSLRFIHEYATEGMYIITLTITDCASCTFVYADTVYAFPDLQTGLQTEVSACDSLKLTATPGLPVYQWNDHSTNPELKVKSSGLYWVFVADTLGFFLQDTTVVTLYPSAHVTMDPMPVVCADAGTFYLQTGLPYGGAYLGNHVSGEIFNVEAAGPGFYTLGYYLPGLQGCSDTAYQVLEIEPLIANQVQYFQNKTENDSVYYAADTIFVGGNVNPFVPAGPYVVAAGAEVLFKAGRVMWIRPGTVVQAGGHLHAVVEVLNCYRSNNFTPGKKTSDQDKAVWLTVSPNPGSEQVTVRVVNGSAGIDRLQVTDGRGQPVHEERNIIGNHATIDVRFYSVGLYLVRVEAGGRVFTVKLMVGR